jgi:membrane protease YdiL (CAAX protease family)
MGQTPPEVVTTNSFFIAFWLVFVLAILVAGRYHPAIRRFKDRMIAQWKSALAIAGLFVISMGLGSRGILNPYALAIFLQAMVGLAITSSITGYEPLPVGKAVIHRQKMVRQLVLMVGISILVVFPALVIGTIGLDIGRQIFGESDFSQQATSSLTTFGSNQWILFFLLLGGAGIAEETTYRLVCLSFFWKLSGRKWLAVFISALMVELQEISAINNNKRFDPVIT